MLKSANHCFGSTMTIISLVYTLRKKHIFLNVRLIFISIVAFKIINGSSLSLPVFSCYFPAAVKSCSLRPYRSTNSYFNNGPAPYFIFDYRLGKNLITQEQQHHLCNSGTVCLSAWSCDEFTTTERMQSIKLRIGTERTNSLICTYTFVERGIETRWILPNFWLYVKNSKFSVQNIACI